MSSVAGDSPRKLVLQDKSNCVSCELVTTDPETPKTMAIEVVDLEDENMTSQANGENMRSFDEIRQVTNPVLFGKFCETVHHASPTTTFEDELEVLEEDILPFFYPGEEVSFRYQGERRTGSVLVSEKRGGARFYYMEADGQKLPNKIDGSSIKRSFSPTAADLTVILQNIATKEDGKPWQVLEVYRKEYGIKDKIAPIFCTPKRKSNIPVMTDRKIDDSSSEDDLPLESLRRSNLSLHPSATNSAVKKKESKILKENSGEPKKRGRPKKDPSEKVQKEPKEKKEKKPKGSPKKNGDLGKFVIPGTPSTSSSNGDVMGSPFMSQKSKSEKRFQVAVERIDAAWKKKDQKDFYDNSTWAAKILSYPQIENIENDLHRFVVKKLKDQNKNKELLKKMTSKEEKKNFRDKLAEEKKSHIPIEKRIKNHFYKISIVDDLAVESKPLPCYGIEVPVTEEKKTLFTECLIITQFLSSLRHYTECSIHVSAADLLSAIFEGREGYFRTTIKVLQPILKTLIHDDDNKKISRFCARLYEYSMEPANLSELCRAFLQGTENEHRYGKWKSYFNKIFGNENRQDDDNEEAENEDPVNADLNDEVAEDDENGRDSGRSTPNDIDVSQIEMEEHQHILKIFSEEKEFWQLSPGHQLEVLQHLTTQIMGLDSFKNYISMDAFSEEGRQLNERRKKMFSQLESMRQELAEIQIDENVDESLLSRAETRIRGEKMKKKDNLERKIYDLEDKYETVLKKLEEEQAHQAAARRLCPFGQDRHFRNYFLFPSKSPDAGLWIQDFGTTPYEAFVRRCVKEAVSYSEPEDGNPIVLPDMCPNSTKETWYRITDLLSLQNLMDNLCAGGYREGSLKKYITTNMEQLERCILKNGNSSLPSISSSAPSEASSTRSTPAPDVPHPDDDNEFGKGNSLEQLKKSTIQLASELKGSYLTSIDVQQFESKVKNATEVDELKNCIYMIVDSVPKTAIVQKLDFKDSMATGCYSQLITSRFKLFVHDATNPSSLHMLLSYFDSRIDWKRSVVEKKCSSCGSRANADAKIACGNCGLVVHYSCARPRLHEKPNAWTCNSCTKLLKPKEEKAKKPLPMYREYEDEEDEEAGSDDEDDEDEKPRTARKRRVILEDSDFEDDDDDYGTRRTRSRREVLAAKKAKMECNPDSEQCNDMLDTLRGASRLYRSLQTIPPMRGSRKHPAINLEDIEKGVEGYASYEKFSYDLAVYLNHAKEYFMLHNERKLEELEELTGTMDLPLITGR